MKKIKRSVIALLVLCCCVFLSSCFVGSKPVSTGDDAALFPDTFDSEGNLKISFFGVDIDSLQSQTEDTKLIMDIIEKKFKVKFNFINGNASGWKQVLNQYIGGGDVPDIWFHETDQPAYSSWLKDEYLFDFESYLDDYPNLKQAFNRYDVEKLKYNLGGKLYGYPVVSNSTTDQSIINEHGMYYRRDWYENLAKKGWTPTSGRPLVDPEDPNFNYLNFYDLCEGFTIGDPDGNGENDTYGYTLTKDGATYWFYPILSMFDVTTYGWHYSESKKMWLPDCTSEQMKEALYFMGDMYSKGFLPKNYSTSITDAIMKNEFVNGLAGIMTYNISYNTGVGILDLMAQYETETLKVKDICRAMPVVTGKNGKKQMFGYNNNFGFRSINNDVTENKKKKIMEIMDWMLSDEGMMLLNYGIEGKHYRLEGDQIVSLLGTTKDGNQKSLYDSDRAPGIYRIKTLVSHSTIIPKGIRYYDEQIALINGWKSEYLKANPLRYCRVDNDYALTISQLDDYSTIAFLKIVGKEYAQRDKVWEDYCNTYNKKGKSYINAMNMSADDLKVEKNVLFEE